MESEEQAGLDKVEESQVEAEESLVGEILDDSIIDDVNTQAELESAKARADENWEQLLLAKADVENVRRRAQQDVEKAHRFSIEKFAKDLLPVVESLEMGLAAVNDESGDATALREGMELTYKQLIASLEKSGVEQVNPEGEAFNPAFHQAISMVPSPDHAANTVIQVFQKGYTLNKRLLKPAMVIVSQAQPPADAKKIDEQA
ncbi:MAG: nucleotide exchange factor GrpE [Cycloclasticus sp.]|nr:nucleotide exchange factor GrpE [Cycloclasticus sp.]